MSKLEISLVERAKRLLRASGMEVIKTHGSGLRQGEPDLIGCYEGTFVAIEMKRPGETPEPLQHKRLRDWRRAGAVSFWSDDPDEIVPSIRNEISARRMGFTLLDGNNRIRELKDI